MSIADDCNGVPHAGLDQTHDHTLLIGQEAASDSIQTIQTSRDQKAVLNDGVPLSRFILYFMAIHFLLAYCELILIAPLIKLFERSLCITYYDVHDPGVIGPDGGIPESRCKIQEIQSPLATIRGWKSMLDTIPGFTYFQLIKKSADQLRSPCRRNTVREFGRSAWEEEAHGDMLTRRSLFFQRSLRRLYVPTDPWILDTYNNYLLIYHMQGAFPRLFPLHLVWVSSLILLCGGGLFSAAALMWAMAAEAFPEDKRQVYNLGCFSSARN
jgi:hypothetical protein